jgi:amino acid adenylation domain-containing protein
MRSSLLQAQDYCSPQQETGSATAPQKAYEGTGCIHEWIEEQAVRAGERVAVEMGERQLSFEQLNARANQLAHRLQREGVRPESRVGVAVERSPEMVIAILAVLKAGGAYVPLESSQPEQRLRMMVEEIEPEVVLIGKAQQQQASWWGSSRIVGVEEESLCGESSENPSSGVSAENLAYVLYTSGSTGRPKGVMITHRGVGNYLSWMREAYGIEEGKGSVMHSPLGFDLSVTSLWGALVWGQRVVLVEEEKGAAGLSRVLREQKDWSLIKLTPAHVAILNESLGAEDLAGRVRTVVIGGEALYGESLEKWQKYGRGTRLINEYGPTETVVGCCVYEAGEKSQGAVPIGRPIANTRMYVVEEEMNLAPVGVKGEIYIGGQGVGRGYWKQAGLTGERFMADPFAGEAGARMYKTGDIGRWREDGELEYLGRNDEQVKVRGYRIELGDIESALLSDPTVKECVVVTQQEQPGENVLVAFAVTEAGIAHSAEWEENVRSTLKAQLPEYMVPAHIDVLKRMPLTGNGKIDRTELPHFTKKSRNEYVAPENDVEKALAEVWCEVLRLPRIGVHDNYFALGGDSIRSVRVLAIAKERGLKFSLQEIFRYQTIRDLATHVELLPSVAQEVSTAPFAMISDDERAQLGDDIEDAYPLTQLQLGMLYQMEISGGQPRYHNVCSYEIQGRLDEEALQESARRLVRRHGNLRTSFDLSSYSEPLQLVHNNVEMMVPVYDLRHLPPEEQERTHHAFIHDEWHKVFDLTKPPLVRFSIHRTSDDRFWFTLAECHAVIDGWSMTSTIAEIFKTHYELLENPALPPIPPPTFAFRDYVFQERKMRESRECAEFWERELRDAVPLRLPRNAASSSDFGPRVHVIEVPISDSLAHELASLAKELSVPIKSVMLAAYLKVLSTASGQQDVLTGFATHGRPEAEGATDARGLFLNTMPFRIRLGSESWAELVQTVFRKEAELLKYRNYPLAALQSKYNSQPLLETEFHYLHFHSVSDLLGTGYVQVHRNIDVSETEFALMGGCHIDPASSRLSFELHGDRTRISEAEMQRLAGYYERALKAIATAPQTSHTGTCLLSDEEQTRLIRDWSASPAEYPRTQCVHTLVEERAQQAPEAIAVVFENQRLTYAELNRKANKLARYLRRRGAATEARVAICMERSDYLIVALLAVLKAGAAYVGIDLSYPADRIQFMLADSEANAVLTHVPALQHLPEEFAAKGFVMDRDWAALEHECEEDLDIAITAQNLAYISYTSGSTGTPKGVAVPHRAVVRLVQGTNFAEFSNKEIILQFAPVPFDASTIEIWGALANGGSLVVMSAGRVSAEQVGNVVRQQGVTTMWLTAGFFHLMVDSRLEDLRNVRQLMAGGDVLSVTHVQKFLDATADSVLINGYGPTENTTFTCCHRMGSGIQINGSVPIGRPIANTTAFVLDEDMNPVPQGTPGELYTGGDGLARGYWGLPEITAEKFVPNPFVQLSGERLYRTGDRVRWMSDGTLEFLGRIDRQIKIRGFRIDLEEIEAVLERHPLVRQAAVKVFDDHFSEKQLVGYVEWKSAREKDELRRYLRATLPEYMVPAAFVDIDPMPLTANGKIDRDQLPVPDETAFTSDGYRPPGNSTEEILCQVWFSVLGAAKISVNEAFLNLGGDSLKAIRITSKLKSEHGIHVPLARFFELGTIAAIAIFIDSNARAEREREQSDLLASIEQMSEENAEHLLKASLAQTTGHD